MGQFYLLSFMASLTLFGCFALVIIKSNDYRTYKEWMEILTKSE